MAKKFAEHKNLNLTDVNNEVLALWKEKDIFHRSIDEKEGCPQFVFFEGPPSANGHPGIHHVMGRTIKDTFLRYKTMKGYQVKRKAGWDTHGLPVELSVEKSLGITKEDIGKKISVDDYNDACRKNVMMYTDEWTQLTDKMGYFVDLEHPYITYDIKYIESLWWLLKQLYDKDLLYKGYTIQPYSPAAGTGLSSHELNQPGCYRDVKDTTVTAQFKVTDERPLGMEAELPVYVLAWTTTPWTLPSNTALCVGPKIDYVAVKGHNPYSNEKAIYIIAENRLSAYFQPSQDEDGNEVPLEIIWRGKGSELVGVHYRQLMPWVKPCALENDKIVVKNDEAFRVIPGDYVTTEDGTGIVHIAPTFGADDAKVAKDAGIPSLFIIDKAGDTRPMVDFQGKYFVKEDMDEEFVDVCVNDGYWKHSGDYVKNAYDPKYNVDGKYDEKAAQKDMDLNVIICLEMKEEGSAFKIEKHVHNYPHCWRTDKPVLYYPLDSWFIRSTAKKERMFELNRTINWHPESTGTGRFGKWLENLNDWNLSRSRYWGTPLPIWRNRDTKEEICIGSLEELYNEIEKSVAAGVMESNPLKDRGFVPGDMSQDNYDKIDIHRPYVDYIKLVGKDGSVLTRELDLIDVWFDSGAMPYAQIHYPFENKEALDSRNVYPADFIAEGVDQTRGWFFTLHAIATMVFDSVAYKNVISNGLVLDKNGVKMSKRLGNVINPFDCIAKYGTDPVRWYMVTNSSPWDNLSFDPDGVKEVTSSFFIKLHQAYSFFTLYANVDGFDYSDADVPFSERPDFDRWLLSELNTLVKDVDKYLSDYDVTPAGRLVQSFVVDKLSNWYIRLNKKRFWGGGMTQYKLSAYQTLYICLDTLARLVAPISPFYADRLFLDLNAVTGKDIAESVHLAKFPEADIAKIDAELERAMQVAMQVTSMVLSLRKKVKIPVIQALQTISIPATDAEMRKCVERMAYVILAETNVKELTFIESGAGILVKKVKCNFRTMGKKFGKLMKSVNAAVVAMSQEQIAELEEKGSVSLDVADTVALIEREDVEIISEDIPGWTISQEGTITVALDINITPELKEEGISRLVIKRIQAIRKDSGLEITDRILVTIEDKPELAGVIKNFGNHISAQVLANGITLGEATDGIDSELGDFSAKILVVRA
ncbi:MAG: isoleucine--tRNA ligase [Bacteroidales bacterium]|nr:isoleucine--tRNA ligase [Bacteroidales bacterium]MCM1147562.1 isoleucine--tRNA ligase [Bacteroidales bacterium]MCM1206352.1 isoleucine--tRNA ligase [Bacillota bacterium]MCM1511219.1 isoleucine--tRNA ligase [Clostridium sp.]